MVTRRVPIVEWLISKPMRKGVYAECGLLNKEDAEDAGVDESTEIITPSKTGNEHREYQSHESHHFEVVSMLPYDDRVFVQV